MGNQIIALTGNTNSFLAKESDIVLDVSVERKRVKIILPQHQQQLNL